MYSINEQTYIAGDWGTTNLRLCLIETTTGNCLDSLSGPGAAQLSPGAFAETIDSLTAPWKLKHNIKSAFLCGMVGSSIGWLDAGYIDCPTSLNTLIHHCSHINSETLDVLVIPGARCTNPLGAPDVMRGEETQIMGALSQTSALQSGDHLLALPGTHCKWVRISEGKIVSFLTSFSGELYSLLTQHSVLVKEGSPELDKSSFIKGVERARDTHDADLLHTLFEVRSRQISGLLHPKLAPSFLSGLIVGRDIQNTAKLFQTSTSPHIHLIGDDRLCKLYELASEVYEYTTSTICGKEAFLAGIRRLTETY
jgi:2-dehydro-3-deoxygalactonokinase